MAIESAVSETQTQLEVESREEKLTRLFNVEMDIQRLIDEKEKKANQVNALKNEIKAKEKDKVDLLNRINSGQGTVISVAVSSDQDPEEDDDSPSDEELEALDDQEAETSEAGDTLIEGDSQVSAEDSAENMQENMSAESDIEPSNDEESA